MSLLGNRPARETEPPAATPSSCVTDSSPEAAMGTSRNIHCSVFRAANPAQSFPNPLKMGTTWWHSKVGAKTNGTRWPEELHLLYTPKENMAVFARLSQVGEDYGGFIRKPTHCRASGLGLGMPRAMGTAALSEVPHLPEVPQPSQVRNPWRKLLQ